MFSEPTFNSIQHLFSAPGLQLEVVGAGVLGIAVVCYLGRVTWIALSHARQMELAAMQSAAALDPMMVEAAYNGPYCAG